MTRRDAVVFPALTVLLITVMVLATALGTANIPPQRTLRILWDALTGAEGDYPAWQRTVLLWVRLPRVVTAALVGGGLALTGAVMQAIFRNPMAEPGVIGVSAGAAFGAVTALYLGATTFSMLLTPTGAFIGALGCTAIVYWLASSGRGRVATTTLLLAGVAVGSIVSALTSFVLALSLRQWEVGRQMLSWLMGDFEGRSWGHVALAAPLTLIGGVRLALYGQELNLLLTGEESALSLGVDVPALRRNLIVWASLVTAATVAVVGAIGFVGLVAPHMLRLVLGPDNRRLLPASFLGGATFLVAADLLCRAASLTELRPGVVTSLVGGPFFLYLLVKSKRAWAG
ncbi:MAG: iron ABC transporter permease [Chloracidobacterium sp.]|nr:iron ABC transporter permease [Chloracidobacterium sp.]MDW8216031.1 iron ABC transporter permease [Acidobacteriota bacterium]